MSTSMRHHLEQTALQVEALGDIDQAITVGVRRRTRTIAVGMAVAVTVAVLLVAVILSNPFGNVQPEPLQPPTPSPFPGSADFGWPTSSRNPAGVYSLDDQDCGSNRDESCIVGWIHNGYGSGDVDITIKVGADEVIADNGGTPITIAGQEGTYRQFTARQEDWTFEVDGTPVAVNLVAAPGTSPADLAEAHAVIDSMYTEPSDNDLGFRLVFTLTSNDWDSG
jgi:hypothetical protein